MTDTGIRGGFISSVRVISGLTVLSRILGLLRDILCLGHFGTVGAWDYFAVPFMLPNLFRRLFGEGALSAALIPVYTEELHRDPHGARVLARTVVSLLVMLLALITLLGWAVIYIYWQLSRQGPDTQLTLQLAAIMLPYMVLICTVGVIGGLLNVHRHFAAPAAAPIVLNVCMIAAVVYFVRFFGDAPADQLYAVAIAVLVAGFVQLLLQAPALARAGISLRPRICFSDPGLKQVLRLMAPMIIGLSAMQLNALLDSCIALWFMPSSTSGPTFTLLGYAITFPVPRGAVSALYCSQRLYQLPLGVFGIAVATAIFPHLSTAATKKDYGHFSQTLNQGLRLIIFIAIPATLGLIVLRTPLAAMFQRNLFTAKDTQRVAWTLLFYALGIGAYCAQHIVVRAYYSLQDSVTPVKIAVKMIGLNLALNLVLIWPLGTGGLALSTAVCATIQVAILLRRLVTTYSLNVSGGIAIATVKTVIAAAIMAVAGHFLLDRLPGLSVWLQLAIVTPACAGLFAVAAWCLRVDEMKLLLTCK